MKRLICCILILMMCTACAEALYDTVRVTFEDGFSLSVPSDWVSYQVCEENAQDGYLYCLGTSDGSRLMYIQRWAAEYADLEALQADLEACPDITLRSASVNAQGVEFLMYNFTDLDASGCMTFCEDSVINLLFIPQSDTENMLIAASTMESFCF